MIIKPFAQPALAAVSRAGAEASRTGLLSSSSAVSASSSIAALPRIIPQHHQQAQQQQQQRREMHVSTRQQISATRALALQASQPSPVAVPIMIGAGLIGA